MGSRQLSVYLYVCACLWGSAFGRGPGGISSVLSSLFVMALSRNRYIGV